MHDTVKVFIVSVNCIDVNDIDVYGACLYVRALLWLPVYNLAEK